MGWMEYIDLRDLDLHKVNAGRSDAEQDYELRTRAIHEQVKKANLFSALESGVHSPTLIEHLNDVERELSEMIAARDSSVVQPIPLPANLPALYRHYVSELVEMLTSEKAAGRAVDEIRQIIERIAVNYESETKFHTMEIVGNIVEILERSNLPEADRYQRSES